MIRSVRRKTKMMRGHMSRVVLCRKRCTFILSHLSRAGVRDTCCNRTVAGQEWMNDYVHSPKKLKLKYWTLPCQERFKFGAGDPVVCKTACFIPVLVHGACAIVRASMVPGKLMLLIGKDTLQDLRSTICCNRIGDFQEWMEIMRATSLQKSR